MSPRDCKSGNCLKWRVKKCWNFAGRSVSNIIKNCTSVLNFNNLTLFKNVFWQTSNDFTCWCTKVIGPSNIMSITVLSSEKMEPVFRGFKGRWVVSAVIESGRKTPKMHYFNKEKKKWIDAIQLCIFEMGRIRDRCQVIVLFHFIFYLFNLIFRHENNLCKRRDFFSDLNYLGKVVYFRISLLNV